MVEYNINAVINTSHNCSIKTNKQKTFFKKKVKFIRGNTKNIINKRILIILIIFYIKIQIYMSDNSVLTLKILKGVNSIIYKDFKNYLSEIYINDINMTNIETSYNFTENENTFK